MSKTYLIGTDIGTSSTKTIITDCGGNVISSATEFYGVLEPFPAWAEQQPEVWLSAVKNTVRQAVLQAGIAGKDVASICISGLYGGSGVPLDQNMEVVRPCIIWMDRRSSDICGELSREADTARLFEITGNGVDSYFGYTKILWIKKHEPELWKRIRMFLPPNQYVIYRLTGQTVIDHTAAGNLAGIYDLERGIWSGEMCRMLGIPMEMMPQNILESYETAGVLTDEAAGELGLAAGIPVCAGCVDCLSSTLASGTAAPGQHVAVLATSLNWGLLHTDRPRDPKYITMPFVTGHGVRYTYGGMSTAGALTRWFSEQFAPGIWQRGAEDQIPFSALEEQAAGIRPGSEGLMSLPYFMGERCPIWDHKARGALLGLTLRHSGAHVYRALLEAVGYAMKHIMEDYGFVPDKTRGCRLVGGGSASKLWVQILADITGVPMECAGEGIEAPYGSAFLAGYSAGIHGFEDIGKWERRGPVVRPDGEKTRIYQEYFEIYKDLYYSIKEDMHKIADLSLIN